MVVHHVHHHVLLLGTGMLVLDMSFVVRNDVGRVALLLKWIVRIQVVHKQPQLIYLLFHRFSGFKIFILNSICLPAFENSEVAAYHLEFVADVLELNGQVEIFVSHCLVFLLCYNCELLLQFRFVLFVV